MSRSSAGFADFFPTAPSVLQQKKNKERQRAKVKSVEATVATPVTSLSTEFGNAATARDEAVDGAGKHNSVVHNATAVEQNGVAQDDSESVQGDLLNGVGSASSHTSTVSSVFSAANSHPSANLGTTPHGQALTPLTVIDSSPPRRALSPSHAKTAPPTSAPEQSKSLESQQTRGSSSPPPAHVDIAQPPPPPRLKPRPGKGQIKGLALLFDPEDRRRMKPKYENFGEEEDMPNPPADPRLAIPDYCKGSRNGKKRQLRKSLYVTKPWAYDPITSLGPGPPTRIVVILSDPLASLHGIRALFESYGEVSEFTVHNDPTTGTPLGVISVRYQDRKQNTRAGPAVAAVIAARRAVKEANQQKVSGCTLKVELDKTGKGWRRQMDKAISQRKPVEEPQLEPEPVVQVTGPPPTAPKGPSGKPSQRPDLPPALARPAAPSLIESTPVLQQLKREPYIFIANVYVPVLGATIAHLKRRLKGYSWTDVKADSTGYYVIFEDHRRGELEAQRCFDMCNLTALFTYVMNMECQKFGKPDYVRSPSPERLKAEQYEQKEQERRREEEEMVVEEEKRQRADNLDPAVAALEILMAELSDISVRDVRKKIAAPALYDYLDPDKHVAKRRKLGIDDPSDAKRPTIHIERADEVPGTPDSNGDLSHGGRRPLGSSTYNITALPRIRKIDSSQAAKNVGFADPFGQRKRPTPKRKPAAALYRRLYNFGDSDGGESDEEGSSIARDTEDQESRPISRMSSEMVEDDRFATPAKRKSRLSEKGPAWGEDSDDEAADDLASVTTGPVSEVQEDVEMQDDTHLAVSGIKKRKRVLQEAAARKRSKLAEIQLEEMEQPTASEEDAKDSPSATNESTGDLVSHGASETPDPESYTSRGKQGKKPKPKKKTKKQLFEEREFGKAQDKVLLDDQLGQSTADLSVESEANQTTETKLAPEDIKRLEELGDSDGRWAVTTDFPRPVFDIDDGIVLDIDGWQELVKDAEDVRYLKEALQKVHSADLGNHTLWTHRQKEIKALNRNGERGAVRTETQIEGYYVPNVTGSARTEGVKKILESEKSKYLPHRIKVQKAREEREARAKYDPVTAAELAKAAQAAKVASKATSRSNRANNRRFVADLNAQRQTLSADADALKFNQLKKRKKLVKFARSAIHNWGLYAMENIAANDMIIEYVGEKVRQQVADMRERRYQKSGIGSSYLFRIDENTVVDATKRGGIARFINHSCTPNCTAKIIKVEGSKRIVIYALRDIAQNEELTYDYKFEREMDSDDRIPCLCGSTGCKGFLN